MASTTPPSAYHPELAEHFSSPEQQRDTASAGMWLFLLSEVLFFGGLFTVYAVYRYSFPVAFAAASHHLDVALGATNTVVLLASSLTMALAVQAASLGKRRLIVLYLLLTLGLGCAFMGIKTVEYRDKFAHHLVPGPSFSAESLGLDGALAGQAQLFYSLYFGLTGLHALHMLIGMAILGGLAVAAQRGRYGPAYYTPVEITGLYWHFVDVVWIFLFPLLYLVAA